MPQEIRKKLGIKPKTKLLVYVHKDAIIMKKLEVPDVVAELKAIFKKIDARTARYGELTDEEITEIIQKART
jgi:bifunctional DNA-binding transcriptional regulator/antitoxin component of YhaV-PrlF toxin-antitoxin module